MTHQHSYMTIEDMFGYPFDRCATCGHESRLGCPCPDCDVEARAEEEASGKPEMWADLDALDMERDTWGGSPGPIARAAMREEGFWA